MNNAHQHPDSGHKVSPEITLVQQYVLTYRGLMKQRALRSLPPCPYLNGIVGPGSDDEDSNSASDESDEPDDDLHVVEQAPPYSGGVERAPEGFGGTRSTKDPRYTGTPRIFPHCQGAGQKYTKNTLREDEKMIAREVCIGAARLAADSGVPGFQYMDDIPKDVEVFMFSKYCISPVIKIGSGWKVHAEGRSKMNRRIAAMCALAELPATLRCFHTDERSPLQPVLIHSHSLVHWKERREVQRVAYVQVLRYQYEELVRGSGQMVFNVQFRDIKWYDGSNHRKQCISMDCLKEPVIVVLPVDYYGDCDDDSDWRLIPILGKQMGMTVDTNRGRRKRDRM